MAPMCPEEVDVFTVPHTRMKELVEQYLHMLTSTNFADAVHLTNLLENLCKTFREFIAHEQIENRYIMKKLKHKLHSLSIENNAVCNCHKDNQLTDMLNLLHDGYKCTRKSDDDRNNYGLMLRQALDKFTSTFIPHMEEEEEVFQPLLMQHFTTEELKQIKAKVIEQHFRIEADEVADEKFVHDSKSSKLGKKTDQSKSVTVPSKFDKVPDELVLKIFSNLNPRDLARASQVNTRWRRLAVDGSLWTQLFPVSWAKGNWDAHEGVYAEEDEESVEKKLERRKAHDEDADIDESEAPDDWDAEAVQIEQQSRMLTSMCKHLLPKVGPSIRHCDLAYSKGLTNGALYKILSLCPNLEYLDLTQTRISDLGFKGLQKDGCGEKLRHVDLTGCLYITDKTLERLAAATLTNTPPSQPAPHTGSQAVDNVTQPSQSQQADGHVILQPSQSQEANGHVTETSQPQLAVGHHVTEPSQAYQQTGHVTQSGNSQKLVDERIKASETLQQSSHVVQTQQDGPIIKKEQVTKQNYQQEKSKEQENKTTAEQNIETVEEMVDAMNEVCDTEYRNDGPVEQDTARLEEALSRLRCCYSNQRCCCGDTDIETSQTAWKCCRRAGKNPCETCPWRKRPKGERSRTNKDDLLQANENSVKCQGHVEVEGKWSRTRDDDQVPSSNGRSSENKGERSRTFHDDQSQSEAGESASADNEGQRSGVELSSEQPLPSDQICKDGDGIGSQSNTNLEKEVEDSPDPLYGDDNEANTVKEANISEVNETHQLDNWEIPDLRLESWEIPGQTFIPELYILPQDRANVPASDLDLDLESLDSSEIKTLSEQPERGGAGDDREGVTCGRVLQFLSLSGCHQITDLGLQYLTDNRGLPHLRHLDLSGCLNVSGKAVTRLVATATGLDPAQLFYCDNIVDGPYTDTASGCQNLQCVSRVCCRVGE